MARTRVITKESYNKALTVQQGKTTDTQGKSTQQNSPFFHLEKTEREHASACENHLLHGTQCMSEEFSCVFMYYS